MSSKKHQTILRDRVVPKGARVTKTTWGALYQELRAGNLNPAEVEEASDTGLTSIDDWESGDEENCTASCCSESTLITTPNSAESIAIARRRAERAQFVARWRESESWADEAALELLLQEKLDEIRERRRGKSVWQPKNLLVLLAVAIVSSFLAKKFVWDTL